MIRRSEADALEPVPVDDGLPGCVAYARSFYCSKGYDMLNVDVSLNGEVVARYFADPVTSEFKGHLMGDAWSRITLENIIQKAVALPPRVRMYSGSWYMQTADWHWYEDSNSTVYKALGTYLEFFEQQASSRAYYDRKARKWQRLQMKIRESMKEPPKGFIEWVKSLVFKPYALLSVSGIKGNEKISYVCTECGQEWERGKKYRQSRLIKCPHCGAEIKVRNSHTPEMVGVYLFQASNKLGEWYYRHMEAYGDWENGWVLTLKDRNLAIVPGWSLCGTLYYANGSGWSDKKDFGKLRGPGRGYIYPDFGGAEEVMTDQQERCLRALAEKGWYVNANKVVIHHEEPGLEYLIKGGYERLAKDVIEKTYGYMIGVDDNAEDLAEYLGINRQRCFRLRQMNGSYVELEWLRYEEETGKKVSAEDLKWFGEKNIEPNMSGGFGTLLKYVNSPAACRHYLEKQSERMGYGIGVVLNTYTDYINMARLQNLNLASPVFYKPKDLEAAHNECVRFAHTKELENKENEVKEKFPEIPGILSEIHAKYAYESGKFAIVVPERIMDILNEGRALGHCVDTTDRYFERIRTHVTYLVFLRKTERIEVPWYTLEIEPGGTVRQQRTTGNRQIKEDVDAYMPFIREWQKVVRKRISEEDKAAAERSRQIRIAEYKELREKKETVRRGLLAGQLLADVLEADLVEAI
ncbi:MAG: PcfJ domain-containing protein [Lachnospiraceae bacterium]|nr:PcfJ domain-containing protein [Lachnospiraceae bacterium]